MRPVAAFDLGYRSARSGFFFDAMELVAFVAPSVGGIDALRHAIEPIFAARNRTRDDMDWVTSLLSQAYRTPLSAPAGVDDYRELLTGRVFDVVNRWSFIDDIKTVNRLQAWFYAGFGLGRTDTVLCGIELLVRLRDTAGADVGPVRHAMAPMQRLAAEAARQLEVPAQEDDLQGVRPLLEQAAQHARSLSLRLQRPLELIDTSSSDAHTLEFLADVASRIRIDLAHVGASLA